MTYTEFSCLEEFLTGTRVLLEPLCPLPSDHAKETARRMELLAGASPTRAELLHSRLSREFEQRLNALGNKSPYIVMDFTRDKLSSNDDIAAFVNRKYALLLGHDNGSRISASALSGLRSFGAMSRASCLALEEVDGFSPPCFLIVPNNLRTPSIRQIFGRWFRLPPSRIAAQLPVLLEEWHRMTLHHEGFGHGTRHGTPDLDANDELHADIASMIGILRDTGNETAARARIFSRDLRALRLMIPSSEPSEFGLHYANGRELGNALRIIRKIPGIRTLSDRGIVSLTNKVFARVKVTQDKLANRRNTLCDAFLLAKNAHIALPCIAAMSEKDPRRPGNAISFLKRCMDAYGFFCAPHPASPRPRPAAPAPHPVTP